MRRVLSVICGLVVAASVAVPAAVASNAVVASGTFMEWGTGALSGRWVTQQFSVTQEGVGTFAGTAKVTWGHPAYPERPFDPHFPPTAYTEMFDLALTCYVQEGNQAVTGWEIVDTKWEDDQYVGLFVIIGYQDGPDLATNLWLAPYPQDCAASVAARGFTGVSDFIAQWGGVANGVLTIG